MTHLAILISHHVNKVLGASHGLNIRGGSAIKANVLGYLVLDRDKELFRLSGINKTTGPWEVTLNRSEEQGWAWWIEQSHKGHTRTPQQEAKEAAKVELLGLVRVMPGQLTDVLAEMADLPLSTCKDYLMELEKSGLIFGRKKPREPGQMGNLPLLWYHVGEDLGS